MRRLGLLGLVLLVVQSASLVFLIKHSRQAEGVMYLASTSVCLVELVKLATCLAIGAVACNSLVLAIKQVWEVGFSAHLAVPAFLYSVQNNILFVAVENLTPLAFQITYQLRILTTAVFSCWLLGTRLSSRKWFSLVILTMGVVAVNTSLEPGSPSVHVNRAAGVVWTLAAAVSSGFAGIYLEKQVKSRRAEMWVNSIHLGMFGLCFSVVGMVLIDGDKIRRDGFFQGYTALTVGIVLVQALGGLIVSVVIQYSDNVLKGFATSLSLVISGIIDTHQSNNRPAPTAMLGCVLVVASTYLYNLPARALESVLPLRSKAQ